MFRPIVPEPLIRTLGAALWLRADTGTLNNNTRWINQADPGLIMRPIGAPTFDATGFNGRQTFVFSGTTDRFVLSEPLGTSLITECTLVMACEHDVDATEGLFGVNDGTFNNSLRVRIEITGRVNFRTAAGGTAESDTSGAGLFPVGAPTIFSLRWDGTTVTYRIDGGAGSDTDAHTQAIGVVDRVDVGASDVAPEWDGAISEVAYWSADIGAANVAAVETDMNSRWGVF